MSHLPIDATDDALLDFVDRWAALLEAEEYDRAFAFTEHIAGAKMTPSVLRELVKQHAHNQAANFDDAYGTLDSKRRITLEGAPTYKTQEKTVERWPQDARGAVGEIWYDLNFDGFVTDVSATFEIQDDGEGLTIALIDIGVH